MLIKNKLNANIPLSIAIQFCADEGILVNLKEKSNSFAINSPFINDRRRRCFISYKTGDGEPYLVFHDHIATAKLNPDLYSGSFLKFVKLIKKFNTIEEAYFYIVVKYLREYNFSTTRIKPIKSTKIQTVSLSDFEPLMISVHGDYIRYLRSRGISWDLISKYKVYIDPEERRIVFPVYEKNIPIYYNARTINKWTPKEYRWKKSATEENVYALWNLENVKDEVWLFEGVFDGIFWPTKAVAYFGAVVTQELIDKIKAKNPKRVVLIGQNPYVDKASEVQRKRILELLRGNKLNPHIFNWYGIKEKDMNDAIVNGVLSVESVEERIIPWDSKAQVMSALKVV